MCTILYSCPGNFYPRSPCGERHDTSSLMVCQANFYPRSPCGERRCFRCCAISCITISIHALLAESDKRHPGYLCLIHLFLSTLSLRRATPMTFRHCTTYLFLSTLSLRRATDIPANLDADHAISIHALLAESDAIRKCQIIPIIHFYPRSPCGERRDTLHALLGGYYFYPRSPCGERLRGWTLNINGPIFLSTLSLRRATYRLGAGVSGTLYFYPRSPCGERRRNSQNVKRRHKISIHALLAESDRRGVLCYLDNIRFLSTLSLRRATRPVTVHTWEKVFLSTLSLRRATAKVHKTVGHFCTYETNFMGIASSY